MAKSPPENRVMPLSATTLEGQSITARDNLFRLLVEAVRDYAIFVLDPNGRVATWNAGAMRIKQYTAEEIIGRHFSIFYGREEVASGKCELELEIATRDGSFEEEGWRVRKDGTRFWASVVITAMRDERMELVGFAKVTRDLTERLRGEQEKLALARAADADRRKDDFLAIIGHELRNPMSPMSTAIHLLRTKNGVDCEHEIDVLERQFAQLKRLVDDLMDVASTMHESVKIEPRPVEIATVLDRAVDICAQLVKADGHTLTVDVPRTGLMVNVDVERMTQVFGNLLNNAAKYTERGGSLRLRAYRDAAEVVVEVQDDGRGIEPHNLSRVFDLFTQGERGLDRRGSGLGIGLAVAKEFVKRHGGIVTVASLGVGRGSIFTVRLPRSSLMETPVPFRLEPNATGKRRVVIIDDNEDGAELLKEALRALGHDIEIAFDGPSGLTLIAKHLPDVVFLDIGLPGMNGYEVVRELRKTEHGHSIPIYAVTGYANEAHRVEAMRAGFTAHLPKPISIDALKAILSLPRFVTT